MIDLGKIEFHLRDGVFIYLAGIAPPGSYAKFPKCDPSTPHTVEQRQRVKVLCHNQKV